jgi:nucleoside-diphosphate-sugar epimerase
MQQRARRILVTGAAGFVGAAVTRQLVADGRHVLLLLRNSSDLRRIASLLPQVEVLRCDLQDLSAAVGPIRQFRPDGVAHLAWNGVKGADRNSTMQADNIAASVGLFRLCESVECRRFVGLGSQAEYGPSQGRLSEQSPTRPTTVYGAAKLATGVVLDRLAAAAGVRFAWLRLFSSYGNDDDPSWLLPYLTRSFLQGQRPSVTRAEQRWDYIHVDDVASAVVAALDSGAAGIFNLGSGIARPLREIICTVRDLVDPGLEIGFGDVPYRPDQIMHLEADISALCAATGWSPRVRLENGLKQLVDWHRAAMPSS